MLFSYSKIYFVLLNLFLVIVIGFRGADVDHDYNTYLNAIYNNNGIAEPTFLLFSFLIVKLNLSAIFLFLWYAILGISLKFFIIYKYSKLPIVSVLIYISNILLLHDLNQIRAGVASALLLLSIPILSERKYWSFLIIVITASLFHFSALIFLLFIWINNKYITAKERIFWFLIPIIGLCISFFDFNLIHIIPIDAIRNKLEMYKRLQEMGNTPFSQVNLLNPYFIFKLLIYFFFLWNYAFFLKKDFNFSIYLKFFGISLFVFPVFSIITPIAAYRFSELIGVIEILLFPIMFLIFKGEEQKKIMIVSYFVLLFSINILYKKMIII